MVVPPVAALAVFAAAMPRRDTSTLPVEPGPEQTFPADQLAAGDRFTRRHEVRVLVRPPHASGWGSVSSDGPFTGTTLDGSVTIHCPVDFDEI